MSEDRDLLLALRASHDRLRGAVAPLDRDEVRRRSYCDDWTIAQVLSHLGSGAEVTEARLESALGGDALPDGFAQPIWDRWNAKDPDDQVSDALAADGRLLERLGALTDDQRTSFSSAMGPMTLDLAGFVRFRLAEHAVHTWDVMVVDDPAATLAEDAAGLLLVHLPLMSRFAGKPSGTTAFVRLHTTAPEAGGVAELREDRVSLTIGDPLPESDLELPAEALVRLVYGRLDPGHAPAESAGAEHLDALRAAFPGV